MQEQPQPLALMVTPAGWNYIRQVLGQRPHDEVHPLIEQLEAGVAQQLQERQQAQQLQGLPTTPAPTNPLKGNGLGIADATTTAGDTAP